MRKILLRLSLFLSLCIVISLLPVTAQAAVGETFQVDITVGGNSVLCTFRVLTEPDGDSPGTVQIGEDSSLYSAIPTTTEGELVIPEGVTNAGKPYRVTAIGTWAFDGCSGLTGNLEIPEGVKTIGDVAFRGCSGLSGKLTIPEGVKKIGVSAFNDCSGLTGNLTIPSGVTTIGSSAFKNCKNLTGDLMIPLGVTTIELSAFEGCSGLTGDLTIPEKVTTIGNAAFRGCSGLSGKLTIPEGVIAIDNYAFSGCSGLTGDLTIPEGVTSIGWGSFTNCRGLTGDLTIPEKVTTIGNSAFSGCSGFDGKLTIPSGVTTIGNSAFSGCIGLTGDLMIPEKVTTIGNSTFYNCRGLTGNLTIPEEVTSIGSDTFSGCSGLTGNLTIPEGVTSIGSGAFTNCSGLTGKLTIPSGVTTIGNSAFGGCSGFDGNLTIPSDVTVIGYYAFFGLSLEYVTLLGNTAPSVSDNSFSGTYPIIYPKGATGYTTDNWENYKGRIFAANTQETTPDVTFTATGPSTGTLFGITNGMKYQIGSGEWIDINTSENINLTDLSACTISVVKKGNNIITSIDSIAQVIEVIKAETPNLEPIQPSTIGGSGSIPMTTAHEYSSDGGSTWNGASGETVLAVGTYLVRVKATGTVLTSDNQSLTITAFTGTQEPTPTATFTATGPDTGTLSGVDSQMKYRIVSGNWTEVTSSNDISLTGLSACTISVVRKGNGTTTTDSIIQSIDVNKAATPPMVGKTDCTTPSNNNGTLTGITAAMEYKLSTASSWTNGNVNASDITDLAAGTYHVRVKATGTVLASDNQELTIAAFVKSTPSVSDLTYSLTAVDYDGSAKPLSVVAASGKNLGSITVQYNGSTTAPTNAGTYPITVDIAGNAEYNAVTGLILGDYTINKIVYTGTTTVSASVLEIGQAGATVTLPNLPEGASYAIAVTGGAITMTDLSIHGTTLTYTAAASTTGQTGTMTIPVTGATNYNDYNVLVTVTSTLKQPQMITYADTNITKTYGDTSFTNSLTLTTVNGTITYASDDTSVATVDPATGEVTIVAVGDGSATITAIAAETETHALAMASYTVTVLKKALTLTADNKSMTKGSGLPTFTYTATGLVGSDVVTTAPTMATAADGAVAGTFDITISGGEVTNDTSYEITYTMGTLTVAEQLFTVTITNGTGGGSYAEGAIVTITANDRNGYTFTGWSGSDVTFADAAATITTFIMPAKAITITANYSQNSSGGTPTPGIPNSPTQEIKASGIVEMSKQQDDGAPEINVNNSSDELKTSILTPKEQEMVARGEKAKVILKVTDISASVDDEEKELLHNKLAAENGASENAATDIPLLYLDLTLYKQVGSQEQTKITETNGKISISIEVPESIRNMNITNSRTFYVLRIHDGEVTRIDGNYDPAAHLFTFETDRFSTYALTYEDTSKIQTYQDFHHLQLSAKADKTSQTLSFKKAANIDGYLIYGARCGEEMKELAKLPADITSYTVKGLKQGTYYKYQVKAYRMIEGEQVIIMTSKVIHSVTEGKTYANPSKITTNIASVTLTAGKSKTVKAQVVTAKGKKLKEHTAAIRYESSNKKIATVNSKGKITAKAKGTCYVYAYAQNGVNKRIKVTVK